MASKYCIWRPYPPIWPPNQMLLKILRFRRTWLIITYNLEGNILKNTKLSFHNALPRNCIKNKILEPVGVYVYHLTG